MTGELEKFTQNLSIIVDRVNSSVYGGEYTGSIITKITGVTETIIFSDSIEVTDHSLKVTGLHVGIKEGKAFSREDTTELEGNLDVVDYSVKVSHDLVKEFEDARFSAVYPNIIRFLHTACLYLESGSGSIDHLPFMVGEILNRPVGITHDGGIVLGDRLVITEELDPVFYDALMVRRDSDQKISVTYDPLGQVDKEELEFIILLGIENF